MKPVRTALVGISGIGGYHLGLLHDAEDIELVAVADKWPEKPQVAEATETVKGWGLPVYDDIWTMLDAVDVESVTIATPHPYHAPYTLGCLERGLHVLVEKPVTILASDGLKVIESAKQKDLFVGVDLQYAGYEHSLKLKELICNGDLGELVEIVGVMEWHRTDDYYTRSDWAGKRYYDGLPCWDGVLMNQAVHLLNSALQMGTTASERAVPQRLRAEMYRVHDIECEDIACIHGDLGEANLYFYATTCCEADLRTTLDIVGTRGRASWDAEKAVVNIDGKDEIVFDMPSDRNAIHHNLVNCIRGTEKQLLAPASESVKPTLTINGAYVSAGSIPRVSWDDLGDIRAIMDAAAEQKKMLSEMGVSWGTPTDVVELEDFSKFAGLADD